MFKSLILELISVIGQQVKNDETIFLIYSHDEHKKRTDEIWRLN